MKATYLALFAVGAQADWLNWGAQEPDVTITQTITSTHTVCPCETDPGHWNTWTPGNGGQQGADVTQWNNWSPGSGSEQGADPVGGQGWQQWEGVGPDTTTICPYNGQCYVSTRTHTAEATITATVCAVDNDADCTTVTTVTDLGTLTGATTTSQPFFPNSTTSALTNSDILTSTGNSSSTTTTVIDTAILTSSSGTSTSISTMPTSMSTTTDTGTVTGTTSATNPGQTIFVSTQGQTYDAAMLGQHNVHRANHSAPDLVWDATLVAIAQQIAASCVYGHNVAAQVDPNNPISYGQNIGAGASPDAAPGLITNGMYNNEIINFPVSNYDNDQADLSNFGAWGHFSQIVWASTASVGCATQYCPNGLQNTGGNIAPYFTVCNYFPAGNFVGQFSNVHAPRGDPTVVVET